MESEGASAQHQGGSSDDDPSLRLAVTSLKPALACFGLVPSRLCPYIMITDNPNLPPSHVEAYSFLVHSIKGVLKDEYSQEEEGMELAVRNFVEKVLCDEAPPSTLCCFMHALRLANEGPQKPSPGAWQVHDILKLSSAYLPLHQALLTLVMDIQDPQSTALSRTYSQIPSQSLEGLPAPLPAADSPQIPVTSQAWQFLQDLADQLRAKNLLSMDEFMQFLDILGQKNANIALWHLMAMVYKTVRTSAVTVLNLAKTDSIPDWLETLVKSVERVGGQTAVKFRLCLPRKLLAASTWKSVCDQLMSLREHCSTQKGDDTQSEAGESNITDLTIVNMDGDDRQKKTTCADDKLPELNLPGCDPQTVQQTREQRTAQFIQNNCPVSLEYIEHSVSMQLHLSECHRGFTEMEDTDNSSVSTDNNDSLAVARVMDNTVRDLARTLRYTGLSDTGPGNITLRAYQEELLGAARQGRNIAIFLPTGTGKTFVVLKYIQEHLSQASTKRRVAFLAPKVKLADQQYRRFQYFFPGTTYLRTGRSRSCTAPFSELLLSYQVYVMTPMCLVEAVKRGEVKVTDFSLFVLDECHHTSGKHDFKLLMDEYMDCKFTTSPTCLPQVIGLTASPGAGQGTSQMAAMNHIRELCYNLDVEKICTVKHNMEELKLFINEPKHDVETHRDSTQQAELEKILKAPDLHRGKLVYTQWVIGLENKLAHIVNDDKDTYMFFFSSAQMLLKYQRCLILNEDCESRYALMYLQEQISDMEETGSLIVTERKLLSQFKAQEALLDRASTDPQDFNPKLHMLEDLLLTMIDKHQDQCACMVFVKTIELSLAVQRWIQDHPDLKILKPGRIIGSRVGGMTKHSISDVMDKFNKGDHQVVVCTSAAEEGLDFQACNVVIRYDYITSMIAMIQTRGRARQMDSQYCVLGNQSQGSAHRERGNLASEKFMNQAISSLQAEMDENSNSFLHRMNLAQQTEWRIRKERAEQTNLKRMLLEETSVTYQLLCRKCRCLACYSTDIYLLEETNRLVLAEGFEDRWKRVEKKAPDAYQHNIEKVAKVHCKDCSHDWGCLIKHAPSQAHFPLLKLEGFFLKDDSSGKLITTKLKWSKAPFSVQKISHEELVEWAVSHQAT